MLFFAELFVDRKKEKHKIIRTDPDPHQSVEADAKNYFFFNFGYF